MIYKVLSYLQVMLGGGRAKFLPKTLADWEYDDRNGARNDGRNLVEVGNTTTNAF